MKNLFLVFTLLLIFSKSAMADGPKVQKGCTYKSFGDNWLFVSKDNSGKEHSVYWKKNALGSDAENRLHLLTYTEALNLCRVEDKDLPTNAEYEALWNCFDQSKAYPNFPLSEEGLKALQEIFPDMIVHKKTNLPGGFYTTTISPEDTHSVVVYFGDGHIGRGCRNCTSFPGSARCVTRM